MDKILVVDDEKPTLAIFRFTLKAYGYTVFTAENGKEGLQIFEQEKPPIVITDIKMPGMGGLEVLRRIKEMDASTEIIVITGYGGMDLAVEALELDATDFISKPIQQRALERALLRAKERIKLAQRKEKQISVHSEEKATVIRMRGNITSQSEMLLKDAFEQALSLNNRKIVMGFDENVSINGAGIAILTQLLLDIKEQGHQVVIAGLSENFKNVFNIVGVSKIVKIFDSVEEALSR
ncbi:MAG: response regulator [Deltaproteobacteria bacterium]|nr:MAG: response regulator [Deltaproteobacteria bacterium]